MQNIPHKPSYLLDTEWQFILERDCRACACMRECRNGGKLVPCSPDLDVDHIHPRELGGDDSVANLRLLCRNHNRGRRVEPDEKWAEASYWDAEFAVKVLREVQKIAGYGAIMELADTIRQFETTLGPDGSPNNFRCCILGNWITLIPGATGIGKTLLMQSSLFTLNKIIGLSRPRAKYVLWLSPDTTIRDLTAQELESEATEIGLVQRAPKIKIAKSFSSLASGPCGAAITVACPQVLWEKDTGGRSNFEKIGVLLQYDVVVFDEVDWASDQVRHIADLAKHAIKFSLTASPPLHNSQADQLKEFLRRFVLISNEAIADCVRARDLDGCLKYFADPVEAAGHDAYDYFLAGIPKEARAKMPADHPLYIATILQAVVDADREETSMKEIPETGGEYFSPHVQVAMPSIHDIKTMRPNLGMSIEHLYAIGILKNPGWAPTAVYGGHERDVEADERDLSAKTRDGKWRHPFMVAKNNNGKATEKSKRILLMCKIGDRALNNWPISKFVDNTGDTAFAVLIQRDLGRPARWPQHLATWLDKKNEKLHPAATATIYVPATLMTDEKRQALKDAVAFVENMKERVAGAGFLTWTDLMSGNAVGDVPPDFDPTVPPLTQPDRYKIQAAIAGIAVPLGGTAGIDRQHIEPVIAGIFPAFKPRQVERAVNYAEKLVGSEPFRKQETTVPNLFTQQPVSVMEKLQPQERYSVADLVRFAESDPFYKPKWNTYVERLEAEPPDEIAVHSVSGRLRELQRALYRAPSRTRRLCGTSNDPGVLMEVANELARDLYEAGQAPEDKGAVPAATHRAAMALFGLADSKEGGDMDHPAYHIAILGRYRRDIQRMARGILISEGALGTALAQLAEMP